MSVASVTRARALAWSSEREVCVCVCVCVVAGGSGHRLTTQASSPPPSRLSDWHRVETQHPNLSVLCERLQTTVI